MPNLMQRGASWLGARMKTAAGRSVVIRQGGKAPVTGITATISLNDYEVVDEHEIKTVVHAHDWTFVVADLGTFQFRSGDEIEDVDTEEKYEAMPIDKRPCAERLDSSGILLVVHTKRVD